ncbi:MAG: signal peptidase I [Candidatus Bathyarchaeota archaeon]|nr:signal peptidase I [Candidatus Bathyarchaeota archaeon]
MKILATTVVSIFFLFVLFYWQPRFVVVTTHSMKPTLNPGDVLLITRVDARNLQVGDIIVYTRVVPFSSVNVVSHRIVNITEANGVLTFNTKGDALKEQDSWSVLPSEIKGKVLFVIPKVGGFFIFVRSNMPMIILVALGVIIALIVYRRDEQRIFCDDYGPL